MFAALARPLFCFICLYVDHLRFSATRPKLYLARHKGIKFEEIRRGAGLPEATRKEHTGKEREAFGTGFSRGMLRDADALEPGNLPEPAPKYP